MRMSACKCVCSRTLQWVRAQEPTHHVGRCPRECVPRVHVCALVEAGQPEVTDQRAPLQAQSFGVRVHTTMHKNSHRQSHRQSHTHTHTCTHTTLTRGHPFCTYMPTGIQASTLQHPHHLHLCIYPLRYTQMHTRTYTVYTHISTHVGAHTYRNTCIRHRNVHLRVKHHVSRLQVPMHNAP